MFLKAAVLTLALVAITGTRAEVTSDQVANVVWDYFTQLSNNAKEAVEQFQKTDVTQQLSTLFQDKLGDASTYADGVHNKLVPFVVQLSGHLAQETERVKEEIKKERERAEKPMVLTADLAPASRSHSGLSPVTGAHLLGESLLSKGHQRAREVLGTGPPGWIWMLLQDRRRILIDSPGPLG